MKAVNPNLVPTPVVDRNGRTTTVYRRQSVAATESSIPPAPQTPVREVDEEALSIIADMMDIDPDNAVYGVHHVLGFYRKAFVEELVALITQEDRVLASSMAALAINGENETFIRECNFFLPLLTERNHKHGVALVRSIRESSIDWSRDYSKASSGIKEQCLALMNTLDAVEEVIKDGSAQIHYQVNRVGHHNKLEITPVLKNEALERAVTESPESAPEIIAVIRNYGTTDYQAIRAILDGAHPSVADGAL